MNNRPLVSSARPTGRKQLLGQPLRFAFVMISFAAVVLVDAATGSPLAKSMLDSLYPMGGLRFPEVIG